MTRATAQNLLAQLSVDSRIVNIERVRKPQLSHSCVKNKRNLKHDEASLCTYSAMLRIEMYAIKCHDDALVSLSNIKKYPPALNAMKNTIPKIPATTIP